MSPKHALVVIQSLYMIAAREAQTTLATERQQRYAGVRSQSTLLAIRNPEAKKDLRRGRYGSNASLSEADRVEYCTLTILPTRITMARWRRKSSTIGELLCATKACLDLSEMHQIEMWNMRQYECRIGHLTPTACPTVSWTMCLPMNIESARKREHKYVDCVEMHNYTENRWMNLPQNNIVLGPTMRTRHWFSDRLQTKVKERKRNCWYCKANGFVDVDHEMPRHQDNCSLAGYYCHFSFWKILARDLHLDRESICGKKYRLVALNSRKYRTLPREVASDPTGGDPGIDEDVQKYSRENII